MNSEILTRFLDSCTSDPALQGFAGKRRLSLYFLLSDPSPSFFMIFGEGEVRSGLGKPDVEPDLTLRMTAEIFDAIMCGRISAMAAGTSGRIRFSGDMLKAMPAQTIQNDLIRLYKGAKQVGDQAAR
jgi:putative sterol carrier protein